MASDDVADRSLAVGMGYTAPLTPQKCLDACHAQGYLYAGLEYADVSVLPSLLCCPLTFFRNAVSLSLLQGFTCEG